MNKGSGVVGGAPGRRAFGLSRSGEWSSFAMCLQWDGAPGGALAVGNRCGLVAGWRGLSKVAVWRFILVVLFVRPDYRAEWGEVAKFWTTNLARVVIGCCILEQGLVRRWRCCGAKLVLETRKGLVPLGLGLFAGMWLFRFGLEWLMGSGWWNGGFAMRTEVRPG